MSDPRTNIGGGEPAGAGRPFPAGLRVLFTNNTLDRRAGTECWVRDMAGEMLRRGVEPVAYSTILGPVADEMRSTGVPVVDDLARLAVVPDLIHAHHHIDAVTAMLRFPDRPVVFACHGMVPWQESPPVGLPGVRRWIAVDRVCRERLTAENGIPPGRVSVVRNFADLRRFPPRGPLPARPRRAVVLSNYVGRGSTASDIHGACREAGIEVSVVGDGSGTASADPGVALREADIAFAKGRAAIEAAVTGCFVVVGDLGRMAGALVPGVLDRWRDDNFGLRTLQFPITREAVAGALAAYDPTAAAEVSDRMRAGATLTRAADELTDVWRAAVDEHAGLVATGRAPSPAEVCRGAAEYLRSHADVLKRPEDFERRMLEAEGRATALDAHVASLVAELEAVGRSPGETADLRRAVAESDRLLLELGVQRREGLPPAAGSLPARIVRRLLKLCVRVFG